MQIAGTLILLYFKELTNRIQYQSAKEASALKSDRVFCPLF